MGWTCGSGGGGGVKFIQGGGSKAKAVCDLLNRRQHDVENHWQDPERIKITSLPVRDGTVGLLLFSATAAD